MIGNQKGESTKNKKCFGLLEVFFVVREQGSIYTVRGGNKKAPYAPFV